MIIFFKKNWIYLILKIFLGTNNGGDFPKESLLGIYNRIKKVLFVWLS